MAEALVPTQAVHPQSGEVIALDRPMEDLGAFLADVRDFEHRLREAKFIVGQEILRRMDRKRHWTERVGDYELRAPSDEERIKWDGEMLQEVLARLVSEGHIDAEAMDAAIEVQMIYKVKKAGINALRKNRDLALWIDECWEEDPKPRYVSVKRAS